MKKIIAVFLTFLMMCSFAACGGGTASNASVFETDNIKVEAVCVDDSYVDEDGNPLKMVYLYYTVTATDSNLSADSKYTDLIIGENTYTSEHYTSYAEATEYTPNYYYGSYIEDVYVGESMKVIATFKIPEGDLEAGKAVTFADASTPGFDGIKMTTDEFQHFASAVEIGQAMDPEGYAEYQAAREDADEATVQAVREQVDGYYWTFYVNYTTYELEFYSPDRFELRTSLGTAQGGSYSVKKGYIFCTYDSTGHTIEVPYTLGGSDGIELDCVEAFDVMG